MKTLIGCCSMIGTIAKHRIALYKAGKKLGVPFTRILKHDNSKLHLAEFMPYVRKFKLGINNSAEWFVAWKHHWQHNDHHIEYWQEKKLTHDYDHTICEVRNINRGKQTFGGGVYTCDPTRKDCWMSDDAIREMIADWMAASYAYTGAWPKAPNWAWGNEKLLSMLMQLEHTMQPETSTRGFAVALLQSQQMITPE